MFEEDDLFITDRASAFDMMKWEHRSRERLLVVLSMRRSFSILPIIYRSPFADHYHSIMYLKFVELVVVLVVFFTILIVDMPTPGLVLAHLLSRTGEAHCGNHKLVISFLAYRTGKRETQLTSRIHPFPCTEHAILLAHASLPLLWIGAELLPVILPLL